MSAELKPDDFYKATKSATLGLSDIPKSVLMGTIIGASSGWFQQVAVKWLTQRRGLSMKTAARDREIERFQRDVYDGWIKGHLSDITKVAQFDSPSGAYDRSCAKHIALGLSMPSGGQHISPFFKDMRSSYIKEITTMTDHSINSFRWRGDQVNYATLDVLSGQNGNFGTVSHSQLSGGANAVLAADHLMAKRILMLEHFATMLKNQYFNTTARNVLRDRIKKVDANLALSFVNDKKSIQTAKEAIAIFENSTSGMISGLMPQLLRVGCSQADYTAIMKMECWRGMKDYIYADYCKDGNGQAIMHNNQPVKLHWGFSDPFTRGVNSQNTLAEIYQGLTAGQAKDFRIEDGRIVNYNSNGRSLSTVYGCEADRFGAETLATKNKAAILALLENDNFHEVQKDFLEMLYLGKADHVVQADGTVKHTEYHIECDSIGGEIKIEKGASGLSQAFQSAMGYGETKAFQKDKDGKYIFDKSVGMPQELLTWQAIANNDLIEDYIRENNFDESKANILRARKEQMALTIKEMQQARPPSKEYVQFARSLKSKGSGPEFAYIMYGAGEPSWDKYNEQPLLLYALASEKWGLNREFEKEMRIQKAGIDIKDEHGNVIIDAKKATLWDLLESKGELDDAQQAYIGQKVAEFATNHPEYKEHICETLDNLNNLQKTQLNYAGQGSSQFLKKESIERLQQSFPKLDSNMVSKTSTKEVKDYGKKVWERE
ncbi:MAG: hypothetical protein FWE47_01640 [Oscillospiraceae bacterium]|nr:hypothetical protein [Oscillospiraceae bacterium]